MNNNKRVAHYVSEKQLLKKVRRAFPGVLICVTIGMAASFLSGHYGGPLMLYALLLGMGFNFLADNEHWLPGIELAARKVLRLGVALLGARITFAQVASLGMQTVFMVLAAVTLTIGFGWLLARRLGLRGDHGLLSGGAVAICGASAALAISSVLPRHPDAERNLILTVVGVTTLSTVAMVVYPLIANAFGMNDHVAGIFLGATIHDVAQVVGAGHMMSTETGDTSTIVKLLRVALLVPVVFAFGFVLGRGGGNSGGDKAPIVPFFLFGFALLVAANSLGWIPDMARNVMVDLSGALLVTAIAALGIKTSFRRLATVGWKPVILMISETLFLALVVLIVLQSGLAN